MGRFKKGDVVYTIDGYGTIDRWEPFDYKIIKIELTSDEYSHESKLDDLTPEGEFDEDTIVDFTQEYDCISDSNVNLETIADEECFSSSQEVFDRVFLKRQEKYDNFINDLFSANPNEAKRHFVKKRTSKLK